MCHERKRLPDSINLCFFLLLFVLAFILLFFIIIFYVAYCCIFRVLVYHAYFLCTVLILSFFQTSLQTSKFFELFSHSPLPPYPNAFLQPITTTAVGKSGQRCLSLKA